MARILIIDDDQTVLDLEKKYLSDNGHDVLVVNDALVALDILQLYQVDLIIVDIEMPRLNGLQFVATVRRNPELQDISIAFLSCHGEAETIEKAARLKADFYLLKPIERGVFLEKITSFLGKKTLGKYPKVEFQAPFAVEVKVPLIAQIIEVSETGMKILMDKELEEGQVIELPSEALGGIFPTNSLLKVLWVKPYKGNLNETSLTFMGHNMEMVRKLQKYIHSKSEFLRYSKLK